MSAILQHITYNEFLPRVSSHYFNRCNLTTAVPAVATEKK